MLALRLANSLSNLGQGIPNDYSVAFNGTDEYISIDDGAGELNGQLGTISAWFTFETQTTSRRICRFRASSSGNAIDILAHHAFDTMRVGYTAGGVYKFADFDSSSIEGDGKWHHVAGTWSLAADEVKIYLDGTLKDTVTGVGTFEGAIDGGDIAQAVYGDTYWLGNITEFAIFDEVIPIGSLFIADEQPVDLTGIEGLVGYWRLNEGTGAKAYDDSGKGNAGELINTPTWSTDVPYKAG
jgi:hypothetical protein